MTYPLKFREHVLKVRKREGLSDQESAERSMESMASLMRWAKRLEPKLKRAKTATKMDMEALAQDVEARPDSYPYERAQRFGVSQRGIGDALQRLKISYKKTRAHPRADEKARTHFQQWIRADEAADRAIIDLDESGFAQDMPRGYGDSLRGQRGDGPQDWQAKGRTNGIGAIYHHPLLTLTLFDAYIDSDIFYAWTVHDLIPKRPAQAVVVMDHAAFHKRQDTQQALLHAGHTLEYLPPDLPDLHPIEHPWAQAKALRRKLQCDIDSLFNHPSL